MPKAGDLFSAVLGQVLSLHESPTKVKQIIIPDLLISLAMEAIVVILLHIKFERERARQMKKELSSFVEELKTWLNQTNGEAIKQSIEVNKNGIEGDLVNLFQKNGVPKEKATEVSSQIVEKFKSLF